MNIAVFKLSDEEQANACINAHDVERVEVNDGMICVFHKPNFTAEEFEQMVVSRRKRNAEMDLVQFTIHAKYLDTIEVKDIIKHTEARDANDLAIKNAKTTIALFSDWGKEKKAAKK